jgi:hypothetical protein
VKPGDELLHFQRLPESGRDIDAENQASVMDKPAFTVLVQLTIMTNSKV